MATPARYPSKLARKMARRRVREAPHPSRRRLAALSPKQPPLPPQSPAQWRRPKNYDKYGAPVLQRDMTPEEIAEMHAEMDVEAAA